MGAEIGDDNPTKQLAKQHQVKISEAVENQIDKITEGAILDSFATASYGGVPLWYVRQMKRPGTG